MPAAYRDVPVQLAICIGIVLSVAASLMVRNWEQWNLKTQLQRQGDQLAAALERNIDSHNAQKIPIEAVVRASLADLELKQLNFYLYDRAAAPEQRFLAFYESTSKIVVVNSGGKEPVYTEDRSLCDSPTACDRILKVPNRQWRLLLLPTPSYAGFLYHWRSWTILAVGLLSTTVLVTYLLMSLRFTSWNEMLETLSMTDQLTGLLNRRAMDMALAQMLQQVDRLLPDDNGGKTSKRHYD